MEYIVPESLADAHLVLAEAERRYDGHVVLDPEGHFPMIQDANGNPHTDQVLRGIGRQFADQLVGHYPIIGQASH
jgi:hypothetical protein